MKKVMFWAIAVMLAASLPIHAAGEAVQFSKFKFQPDKTYEIAIRMTGRMTTSMGTGTPMDDPRRASQSGVSLAQNLSLLVTLQTFAETPQNVIPMKVTFSGITMKTTSGGENTPVTETASPLNGKEFRAELGENGIINIVGDPPSDAEATLGDWNAFHLLDMIPDFPTGKHKVGEIFQDEIRHAVGGLTTALDAVIGTEQNPWKATYKITQVDGDDVHIESHLKSITIEDVEGGKAITSIGSSGKIIYSLADGISKSIGMNMVINTAVKKGDAKEKSSITGATINNMELTIDVKLVGEN